MYSVPDLTLKQNFLLVQMLGVSGDVLAGYVPATCERSGLGSPLPDFDLSPWTMEGVWGVSQ